MITSFSRKVTLILILFVAGAYVADAQPEMRWGNIDADVLLNDNLTDDPDAKAVILFDKADVYFNSSGNLVFERHKRIKILDPDDSEYTSISINHNQRSHRYRLSGLRAQTFNIDDEGFVETERLRRRDFHEERHEDNWRTTSFTFSDVREGSVIEYDYQIVTSSIVSLMPWSFQHNEPILYSELNTYIPEILNYVFYMTGDILNVETSARDHYLPNERRFSDFFVYTGGHKQTFTAYDMPAIRDEPYMTTVNDHLTKIVFQLHQRRVSPGQVETILEDWDEVRGQLVRHNNFGRQLGRTNRDIRDRVDELTQGKESQLEKAQAIYDYVSTSISWDGSRGLFSDEGIRNTFRDNSGSGPDITFLFIAMIREAGIEAYPVILSTRGNGRIYADWPIISQYNHVVSYVVADGMGYLAEPLSAYLPLGSLLPPSLNYRGKLIDRETYGWIDLNPLSSEVNQSLAHMSLDETGKISGEMQIRMDGYESINNRMRLNREDTSESEFVLNRLLRDFPDAEIKEYKLENVENRNAPLEGRITVEKEAHAMVAGDMMYINPFLLNTWSENPFTRPERNFPVELNYGMSQQFNIFLSLPDGYEIEELPESTAVTFTEDTFYQQLVQPMGNAVQIVTTFEMEDLEISPEYYEYLQTFFSHIVSLQSAQIVLRKSDSEAHADPAASTDDTD